MSDTQSDALPPRRRAGALTPADLATVLRAGAADFRAAPQFGLFFSAVYVVLGLALLQLGAGLFTWTLTLTLGFPLAAPFLAVGLYEVSRRRARGERPRFADVLGVVWTERTRQIPWAGAMILLYVLFWSFFAHLLFALFMGPSAMRGPAQDLATYLSGAGLAMVLTELGFGGVLAFLLFALTVVSLPMLLDRKVDVVTAMRASLRVTRENPATLILWAAIIAGATFLALLPFFLGLFVVLPVLGHASWHLYRRAEAAGALDRTGRRVTHP
ncbi:DUF2189 domain-containing protein [Roseivivax isoporae]|uniref:Membrane protein n=1 Tax=Roseivivax isoporae LMG 25204 TaxID=1449351 RepID=X7F2R0_9RHOB|nr:DUF2189 domain-containing protein [Roseivivax isoporae]ETX27207.1 membrane protein [Roseivivax isoporae LMG 25204]